MATTQPLRAKPSFRRESPSPSTSPTPAIGACPELSRSVSLGSTGSLYSGDASSMGRDSLGSNSSGTSVSRSSSASYSNRQSTGGLEKPKRRGYVRPQGTNFAASAQSRESVLSLGSIAHLQYYFARTGLLDGKGGRLAKKKDTRGTLDLSALDTSFLTPRVLGSDVDSSYASMGSSPELHAQGLGGMLVESPTQEDYDYFSGEEEEDPDHPHMLPPTVSTYNHREKKIPHPPTLEELKDDLQKCLDDAVKLLEDAKQNPTSAPPSPQKPGSEPQSPAADDNRGWHELQGMHILDIMTLAIRAAKMYYTAHNQPQRLAAIKSERKIRAELLSVMEVLKRMATRNFAAGMRTEERLTMEKWVVSVYDLLSQEEAMEEAERKQRASWTWLDDSWEGRNVEREYAFIKSMDPEAETLPEFQSSDEVADEALPTKFLDDMRTGMRLVKLHNAVVRKSKRPFGAIDKWHTDFGKPYRCAENLRYWIKAAELRWEVVLKVDVMGVVSGTDRTALKGFEEAIWKWCAKVREEISVELKV
ncbi:hypothetical protein ONS95_007863 [Cadophora gregata]|uniref:uncharacterized protein n=1 Tax=Cadophora gregata TaxID=51156 RepID=UPI0026DC446E|nr:uncharacterized protein ONS95_007863 [Cadophora gregata]KAK0118997.1 hypothetical protein ONS96_012070 [Cadophora gregata f. sp. sojae]KAK0126250.1 hypothetical protein ONS95_007863 [Cadophora gregata]